ncbi:MAG: 6-carboxytetrahydropterin synthase [Phycisphaerales bacterium]
MVTLRRIVRMGIGGASDATAANGYGGVPRVSPWPAGRHVEIEVSCRGEVDPKTGYFLDIKAIDRAARSAVEREFAASLLRSESETAVLARAATLLNGELGGRVEWVRWNVTPTYSVEVSPMEQTGALLRQKFEIAAAHRLYVPELSEEENRRLFGRCSNPSAHGHNYVIEPCVRVRSGSSGSPVFTLADLERATAIAIVDPFDHRNLNVDCAQFDQSRGGVNPSVENISRVFYGLLKPAVDRTGVELVSVTVWETEKTCSTYPG